MTRKQPIRESSCPKCSGDPTDESLQKHKLSDLGYLHDDQVFECADCGETYTHGVPVGEFDGDAEDLFCDVCNLGYMRVHRVRLPNEPGDSDNGSGDSLGLDLKCHHHHPFRCPHCDERIGADGVVETRVGVRVCPFCDEYVPREEVPYCHYFEQTTRDYDRKGISLVGFPAITGQLNPGREYGFADPTTRYACPECTADDLSVDQDGERTIVSCASCGASFEPTDDPVEPGEA